MEKDFTCHSFIEDIQSHREFVEYVGRVVKGKHEKITVKKDRFLLENMRKAKECQFLTLE